MVLPVNKLGCAGTVDGITANVRVVPLPQSFDGVTVMFPDVEEGVTVIEFVVPPAVCTHPEGKTHVYVVPATLVTL